MIMKNNKLSNYDYDVLLRMKSLRELRSIESILKEKDFIISIKGLRDLKDRRLFLKLKYNL